MSFVYDADGNRVSKTQNSVQTRFVVDRNQAYAQVVHELNAQNVNSVTYTHGDDLISQDRTGNVNYYNYDGLGSTRSLTNGNGQVTDTYLYSAYGQLIDQAGSTSNNYLFAGEQFDSALDQYYLRARYYDAGNGRFTQMDTYQGRMGEPVTLHKYAYGNLDPVNGVDPSGHMTLTELSYVVGVSAVILMAADYAIKFSMHHDNLSRGVATITGYDELAGEKLSHLLFSKGSNGDANPSKADCSKAKKLLKEVVRIAEGKLGKNLPEKRKDELKKKINDGTITSNDLPASIQSQFPPSLRGKTLEEIKKICG